MNRSSEIMALAKAPLRVGLAGGGSDLPSYARRFGGATANFAINRFVISGCWLESSPGESKANTFRERKIGRVFASDYGRQLSQPSIEEGTLEWFRRHGYLGRAGLVLRHRSQVMPGSGLGGSSAAVVACFSSAALFLGLKFDRCEIARAAITIEREICGIPGGIQDFFPAISGGFRLITNQGLHDFIDEPIRVSHAIYSWLSERLIIVPLGDRARDLNLVADQINRMKKSSGAIEAGHTVKKLASVAVQALATEDFQTLVEVFDRTWEVKRQFADGTTTQEMEELRKIFLDNGALALKIAGAGGGGHLVVLCEPHGRYRLLQAATQAGRSIESIRPIEGGVTSWTFQAGPYGPSEGAFMREARRLLTSSHP